MCDKKIIKKNIKTFMFMLLSFNFSIASNTKIKSLEEYSSISDVNSYISSILISKNEIIKAATKLFLPSKTKKENMTKDISEKDSNFGSLLKAINEEIIIDYKVTKSYFLLLLNLIKKIYFMLKIITLMIFGYIIHYFIVFFIKTVSYIILDKKSNKAIVL